MNAVRSAPRCDRGEVGLTLDGDEKGGAVILCCRRQSLDG
jgi:hypothetical protein